SLSTPYDLQSQWKTRHIPDVQVAWATGSRRRDTRDYDRQTRSCSQSSFENTIRRRETARRADGISLQTSLASLRSTVACQLCASYGLARRCNRGSERQGPNDGAYRRTLWRHFLRSWRSA